MKDYCHKVIQRRNLTDSVFVLRLERRDLDFEPGQFIHVGLPEAAHRREYSVYSPIQVDFLEILVKEVPGGHVTTQLKSLKAGDTVLVRGPQGNFCLDKTGLQRHHTFVCTGTGIAPFHCFAGSYPDLNYRILHGIRSPQERFECHAYPPDRYISCISRTTGGDFHGRVTTHLQSHPPDSQGLFYLCGNADMIFEAFDILRRQGVTREQVFTEVYF